MTVRVFVIVLFLLTLSTGSHAAAAGGPGPRLLVHWTAGATASARASAIDAVGATVDTEIAGLGITRVTLPEDDDAQSVARLLAHDPAVAFAELDAPVRTELVPNDALWFTDPYTSLGQWGWRKASVDRAWDTARGSSRIIVAVVDTGVDRGHPDLAGALLPGATFTSVLSAGCDRGDQDDNSHGTHVAGIIGALGNNGIGVSGVAFGVRILPIKALDCRGTGATSDIAQAILWATDHGARIVNISLGTTTASPTLRAAVDYAAAHDVLVVAAVGNCGAGGGRCTSPNVAEYPAAFPGVLAVGATGTDDSVAPFSTQGPQVAVTAPGLRTVSTTPGYATFLSARGVSADYAELSGTSQASAFAAGVAALVWSAEPELSARAVFDRITSTADDLGPPARDDIFGAGRVNALRAVTHAGRSQGFAATYDTRGVPRGVAAASAFTATVRVSNDAATTWRAAGADAVRLAYHWIDPSGAAVVWDGLRTALPGDVAPGESLAVVARIQPPPDGLSYALRFDLVRDGVAWFSDRGVAPADVAVSVDRGLAATYAPALEVTTLIGGSPALVSVTLTNTGIRPWPAAGAHPVRLSYHWLRPEGALVVWDGARAPAFPADVAPGQSASTRLLVVPPPGHGAYVLRLDLVQEGVAWFSQDGVGASDVGFVVD